MLAAPRARAPWPGSAAVGFPERSPASSRSRSPRDGRPAAAEGPETVLVTDTDGPAAAPAMAPPDPARRFRLDPSELQRIWELLQQQVGDIPLVGQATGPRQHDV